MISTQTASMCFMIIRPDPLPKSMPCWTERMYKSPPPLAAPTVAPGPQCGAAYYVLGIEVRKESFIRTIKLRWELPGGGISSTMRASRSSTGSSCTSSRACSGRFCKESFPSSRLVLGYVHIVPFRVFAARRWDSNVLSHRKPEESDYDHRQTSRCHRRFGETRVLVERYLHLVDQGVEVDKIAAVTFTKKAAQEMKDRLRQERPDQWKSWSMPRFRPFTASVSVLLQNIPCRPGSIRGFGWEEWRLGSADRSDRGGCERIRGPRSVGNSPGDWCCGPGTVSGHAAEGDLQFVLLCREKAQFP